MWKPDGKSENQMLNMIFIRLRGKFHEEKCWASLALIIAKMEKRFLKKKKNLDIHQL